MEGAICEAVLRDRLGKDGYEALEAVLQVTETNFLTVDRFEQRLSEEFSRHRLEFKDEINRLRADIRVDLAERTAEVVKWAMLFWVGQAAVVAAIVNALR